MSNSREGRCRPSPTSIRFSDSEKARIKAQAGGIPVGTFIKRMVLGGTVPSRAVRARNPVQDQNTLSQLLGLLGKSHIANNLNQLAKAANFGSLPVTQETEADLRQACADVAAIRSMLMRALGLKAGIESAAALSDAFARHGRGQRP